MMRADVSVNSPATLAHLSHGKCQKSQGGAQRQSTAEPHRGQDGHHVMKVLVQKPGCSTRCLCSLTVSVRVKPGSAYAQLCPSPLACLGAFGR